VDPIDEIAIQNLKSYKEKNFVDISKEDLDLGLSAEPLFEFNHCVGGCICFSHACFILIRSMARWFSEESCRDLSAILFTSIMDG
jgi:hypothetical protein